MGGWWLGWAVVLEYWDKFLGGRSHPPEAGARAALFLLLPASVYPGDINGTRQTRHRSLTLLGPEDSEGQWQVKNFKTAVSWPAGGKPLWVAEEEPCHHLSSQPYLPPQTLPAS